MANVRFHRLSADRREQILRAAGRRFAEHGYEGATVQAILSDAGISAGAAYYYFDNKADLFTEVVRFYVSQLLVPIQGAPPIHDRESFWSSFLGSIEVALGKQYDDHKLTASLRRAWKMSRELRDRADIEREFGRNEAVLQQLVAVGRQVGAIRTDLPAELLVRCVFALNDAVDDWMADLPAEKATADAMRAISAFRRFLESEEACQ